MAEFIHPQPNAPELLYRYDLRYMTAYLGKAQRAAGIGCKSRLRRIRSDMLGGKTPLLIRALLWPLVLTADPMLVDIHRYMRDRPIRLLDYGCGDGHFIKAARDIFYLETHLGVDASEASVLVCKEKGLNAQRELDPGGEQFNLVVMRHVLEHLPNPRVVMADIEACTEDGGLLLLSLPNAGSLGRRIFRERWLGFNPPHHLVNYDRRALNKLLSDTRFSAIAYKTRGVYLESILSCRSRSYMAPVVKLFSRLLWLMPNVFFARWGCEQTVICVKQ